MDDHTASRGRHPTLVLYDEIGWARLRIEVRAANFRSLRGPTVVACILDEVAFFKDETSAQPDVEIYRAVRPAMATVADALLIGISSPFGRSSGRAAHSR
jgi:hypothetical protein